jgi:hypothetical protein
MPVPTVYTTEVDLGLYMISQLDAVGETLGWTSRDMVVSEAVTDALLDYGETSIGLITGTTNLRKLRALARRAIWRAVVQTTTDYYSIADNGQRLERHQVNDQARKSLEMAEYDCRACGADPDYAVSIRAISRPHDPYVVLEDVTRVP